MKNLRTIYNPGVAMVYTILNLITGELVTAATCGIKDVEFKPWRSPKGTPVGKEFFKMKLGSKKEGITIITFLNSSKYPSCISDDGEWEFIGKRPNGGTIPRLSEAPNVKNEELPISDIISKKVKAIIEKVNNNNLSMSNTQIQGTIENEEYVNLDEMSKILN